MKKENYEYLGVPLDLKQLLQGFNPAIFTPEGKTNFKWTELLYEKSVGQFIWIKRSLSEWSKEINAKSGVQVVEIKFNGSRKYCGDKGVRWKSWEVVFHFEISGSIDYSVLHPELSEKFSGFFKKILAKTVLQHFPFPFAPKKGEFFKEIPFCAGIPEMYAFIPVSTADPDLENHARKILFGTEFESQLKEVIEKHSAKLIYFSKSKEAKRKKSISFPFIFVKWKKDTFAHERYALKEAIDGVLLEMGATHSIKCPDKEYKYPFFNVAFEC